MRQFKQLVIFLMRRSSPCATFTSWMVEMGKIVCDFRAIMLSDNSRQLLDCKDGFLEEIWDFITLNDGVWLL